MRTGRRPNSYHTPPEWHAAHQSKDTLACSASCHTDGPCIIALPGQTQLTHIQYTTFPFGKTKGTQ